jgi:hypothetical protein
VQGVAGLLLLLFAAATTFYIYVEGWAPIDAAYFAAATLVTTGAGTAVPQTVAGKLFTMFYIVTGIALFLSLIQLMATDFRRRSRNVTRTATHARTSRDRHGNAIDPGGGRCGGGRSCSLHAWRTSACQTVARSDFRGRVQLPSWRFVVPAGLKPGPPSETILPTVWGSVPTFATAARSVASVHTNR